MMNANNIDDSWLIGAVCLKGNWRFFAGDTGEWILDFARYMPTAPAEPDFQDFRGGIAVVDTPVAEDFITAMEPYEVSPDDLHRAVQEDNGWPLQIVVNFDAKVFVDGTRDMILFCDYVPTGWTAFEDEPLNYVSEDVKAIWIP